MPRPAGPQRPGPAPGDPAGVLGVLVLSAAVAVLALATARGVVHLRGDGYATEFVSTWWWSAFLLAPLPAVRARRRPAAAPAGGRLTMCGCGAFFRENAPRLHITARGDPLSGR